MTYGPPNQPPAGQYPQQPFSPGAAKQSPSQAILAPTAAPNQKSLIVGAAVAVLGLLLIVFSFLNWTTISMEQSQSLGGESMSIKVEMSINGLGNSDVSTDVSLPSSVPDSVKNEITSSAPSADELNNGSDGPGKPAVWMIVFGVLLIAGGVLIVVRRFPGIGAVIAAVAGVAAAITAVVFVADPVGAFGGKLKDAPSGANLDSSVGIGLWLTLLVALVALAGGAVAVLLTVAPDKFGGSPAAPTGFGAPVPGTGGFGQPGQPQPNFNQQNFNQPNFNQPGPAQGGFPPAAPPQQPGQYPQQGQQPPQGQYPPQQGQQPPQN